MQGGFLFLCRVRYDAHMRIPPYVVIQKRRGETPLQALTHWRHNNPALAHFPATYAGRLDPMATGSLLILLGDTCKQQERFHALDKTYEVTVALDLATDTGDLLGLPSYTGTISLPSEATVRDVVRTHTGKHIVPYPAFSSKPVNGIPLFQHTLQGTLDTITIPTHTEHIYTLDLQGIEVVRGTDFIGTIDDYLADAPRAPEQSKILGADFRQDAIRTAWKQQYPHIATRNVTLLHLRSTCASGTYMRSLAERIGTSLGTTGVAIAIHRTRIGVYKKIGPVGMWTKVFV